jgi:hypothetical protein
MIYTFDIDSAKFLISTWIIDDICSFGKLDCATTNLIDRSKFMHICDSLNMSNGQPFTSGSIDYFLSFASWALRRRLKLNFSSLSFVSVEDMNSAQTLILVKFMVFFCIQMKSLKLIGLKNCSLTDQIFRGIHERTLRSLTEFHVHSSRQQTDTLKTLTERSASHISEHCQCLERVNFKFYNDWEEHFDEKFSLLHNNYVSLFSNNPRLISIEVECAGEFRGSLLQVIATNCKQLAVIHLTVGRLRMFYFSDFVALLYGCKLLTSVNLRNSPIESDEDCLCFKLERGSLPGDSKLVLSDCHGYSCLAVRKFFNIFEGFSNIVMSDLDQVSPRLVRALSSNNPNLSKLVLINCGDSDHVKSVVTRADKFRFVELLTSDNNERLEFELKQ